MKYTEFQNKSREALMLDLEELKEKLLKLRFDLADKKLKDLSQIGKAKKDIARILTLLRHGAARVSEE